MVSIHIYVDLGGPIFICIELMMLVRIKHNNQIRNRDVIVLHTASSFLKAS